MTIKSLIPGRRSEEPSVRRIKSRLTLSVVFKTHLEGVTELAFISWPTYYPGYPLDDLECHSAHKCLRLSPVILERLSIFDEDDAVDDPIETAFEDHIRLLHDVDVRWHHQ